MRPLDPTRWFWSPERTTKLFDTLKELAREDQKGWHFGHEGLVNLVSDCLRTKGEADLARGQIGDAIKMLTYFGVIEPGLPGIKTPGYRREFYPDKMPAPFTWAHIQQYREYRATR